MGGRVPNRSSDLSPAGERKRMSRGTNRITTAASKPLLEIEPDPSWHPTALMVWEAGVESGQADFYESSDLAMLHMTCSGIDHWMTQNGRKSPELLRVLMQNLSSLLFTESDRRKARVELEKGQDDDAEVLASVSKLFD